MILTSHPYYPEGVLLSGNNFVANTWSLPTLILVFATACTSLLAVTLVVVRQANPILKLSDQWKVLWFILSESAKNGR
jgi:cholestenol delta-isomerase